VSARVVEDGRSLEVQQTSAFWDSPRLGVYNDNIYETVVTKVTLVDETKHT